MKRLYVNLKKIQSIAYVVVEQFLMFFHQLIFGILGGIIGCYALLVIFILMKFDGLINNRLVMFIGIVSFTFLFVYIARVVIKHYPKIMAYLTAILFVFILIICRVMSF